MDGSIGIKDTDMVQLEYQKGFKYTQSDIDTDINERIIADSLSLPDGQENGWFIITDGQAEELQKALTEYNEYIQEQTSPEEEEGIMLNDLDTEEQDLIDKVRELVRKFLGEG